MDLQFKGKTAIITGGAKGIGSGITEVFVEEGANVICDYRSDPEYCENFIQGLRDKYPGANIYGVQADVSKPDDVNRIFDFAVEKFGRLDILVNNAGGTAHRQDQLINEIPLTEWNDMINNNMTGMFLMSTEFARRLMAENKCGRIAVDLTDKGIICNGIMPGSVRNQKTAGVPDTDPKRQERLKRLPMGRFGEPYEFGKMVAFLASEQCQLAVGAVIDFTGGMMLGF